MKALLGIIGVVGISLGVMAFFYGQDIEASLDRDGLAKECPPSSPIFVRVRNWTFSTVKHVNFRMELYKGQRSRNLLTNSSYFLDYVIEPFGSRSGCYSDEYTDRLIAKKDQRDGGKEHVKVSLSDAIAEVNSAREFGSSHSVYITNVEYQILD